MEDLSYYVSRRQVTPVNIYAPTDYRELTNFIESLIKKIVSATDSSNLLNSIDKQGGLA